MYSSDRSLTFILMLTLLGASMIVVLPFLSSLFWAGLLAFATWPAMRLLTRLLKGRVTLAAALLTVAWMLLVAVPVLMLGFNLVDYIREGTRLVREVIVSGLPPAPIWFTSIPYVGGFLVDSWTWLQNESALLIESVKPHIGQIGNWVIAKSAQVGGGLIQISLSLILVFFFYRDGERVVLFAQSLLNRLIGNRADHYLELVGGSVQRVMNGVIGTAVAQALLALIGFWIAGVPGAMVLCIITFFLSFLPSAPPLVWIPAVGWLFSTGEYGMAVFLGLWGMFVISGVDNVLKPYLISRGGTLPLVLVLIGVFGGLLAFGFMGLFLGPTLLAISYSLMEEWAGNQTGRTEKTV
jgi:predicted PurR-regulated permease PerM